MSSSTEPAKENVLFGAPNVVCTPHLGAATTEAQENVAIQVAEQMADYLTTGAVRNAINMPSISAEEAPRLTPFVRLAEQLGSFAGQLTETGVKAVRLEYEGAVAEMNVRALTAARLPASCSPVLQTVNMVSAPAYRERARHPRRGDAARAGGRLRELHPPYRRHRAAGALGRRHGLLPTASPGSSRSRASTWRPSSVRTCST